MEKETNKEDMVNKIIAFECGELNQDDAIQLFKDLYLNGTLYSLQGTYQRTFNALVESGYIDIQELETLKRL